ncbi:MAG: L-glutamate gamma-semialdehyde dehydrogenase [Thermaerobacter sp.]|nr:L-glutamate gamma-semialdehyde dehydrogenase [Thermaerobacter sp.]
MIDPYRPETLIDFKDPKNRAEMERALETVHAQLGKHYPLVIGGERREREDRIRSYNPSRIDETVGTVSKAQPQDVDDAIKAAAAAFRTWSRVPGDFRARVLLKAAAELRRQKFLFSALEVFEAGKTWPEADGDVAEAIDFMEYYARQMMRLAAPVETINLPGEEDEAFYIPLGVGAIIPPWNFPLAILCGITTGAIVAGNTVLLKPASPTPVVAAWFVRLLEESGLPAGVVNFVPGDGSRIGDYMVGHPLIRFVSFTGSREVGLHINEFAAKHQKGQLWVKRVVAEMGGKDAIVVDETADLDAAAEGIVSSAFGFQGQKCSACSRAIVVDSVYDDVAKKVQERTKQLTVGLAMDPSSAVGPVIDASAEQKILGFVDLGKKQYKLLAGGEKAAEGGHFIQPTVFGDVDPNSALGQEEIFGPVLSMIRAKDFDDALQIANGTEYGLTGSLYSTRRDRLERARYEFHVGNLYFNRKCTGAVVGAHPFGGFNMSGTDSKTGSPDYLLLFMQMKAVAEKL